MKEGRKMEQENEMEYTIEIYSPNGMDYKKVENVKFSDLVSIIKSFELKDYPIVEENFADFLETVKTGKNINVKFEINKRVFLSIPSSVPIMSFSGLRKVSSRNYRLYLTRTK
jgi:hypothetical protein